MTNVCFYTLNNNLDNLSNEWIYYKITCPSRIQSKTLIDIYNYLSNRGIEFWYMRKSYGGSHLRIRIKNKNFNEEKFLNFLEENFRGNYFKNVYEPEINLFGGDRGLDIVHNLFCASSMFSIESYKQKENQKEDDLFFEKIVWVTDYLVKRANDDHFERWDNWKKIEQLRRASTNINNIVNNNIKAFKMLTSLNQEDFLNKFTLDNDNFTARYIKEIEKFSDHLKEASNSGELSRGMRSVLSCVIIFNWNIMGLSASLQSGISSIAATNYSPDIRM